MAVFARAQKERQEFQKPSGFQRTKGNHAFYEIPWKPIDFQGFFDLAVFSSQGGGSWPGLFGHPHLPPAPDPYMYYTCVRARPAWDAVFTPPEGGGHSAPQCFHLISPPPFQGGGKPNFRGGKNFIEEILLGRFGVFCRPVFQRGPPPCKLKPCCTPLSLKLSLSLSLSRTAARPTN